jgi:hypothetical protein
MFQPSNFSRQDMFNCKCKCSACTDFTTSCLYRFAVEGEKTKVRTGKDLTYFQNTQFKSAIAPWAMTMSISPYEEQQQGGASSVWGSCEYAAGESPGGGRQPYQPRGKCLLGWLTAISGESTLMVVHPLEAHAG